MPDENRIRRITTTKGGTHFVSLIPDAAQKASGSVTENQEVTSYVDADNQDGVKTDDYSTEES